MVKKYSFKGGRFIFIAFLLLLFLISCEALDLIPRSNDTKTKQESDKNEKISAEELQGFTKGTFYHNLKQHTFSEEGKDGEFDVSPDGKLIVFSSTYNSKNNKIYLKKVDSNVITTLVDGDAEMRFPKFSPDGKCISFSSNATGNYDIFIIDIEDGKTERLTTSKYIEIAPSWSPDGSKIVFSSFSSKSNLWHINVVDVKTRAVTDYGEGLFPKWSPVTEKAHPSYGKIVFQKGRGRGERWFGVWSIDVNNNLVSEIFAEEKFAVAHPNWSPDGYWIVFSNASTESKYQDDTLKGADLWIIDIKGEKKFQLTSTPTSEYYPCWSKEDKIFFLGDSAGTTNIWSLQVKIEELNK